jgi:MFS family permease
MSSRPIPTALVALQHRNFRLLWVGQLISLTGSNMQTAAILWQVSLLAPQGFKGLALGAVGLVRVVPVVVFSLISGVVADVLDRRKLMLLTQTGMTLVATALAILAFGGLKTLWPVYALAALGAAFGTFDAPARQSLIPNLVPQEHYPNAISLNSVMMQTAMVVGPGLAGIVLAALGIGWAYALNALSFLAVIAGLLLMRGVQARSAGQRTEISLKSAVEGLRYVFAAPLIRSTMLLDFFATFFSSAITLLPIFAQDILQVGPQGYGLLYAAPALGGMLAGLALVGYMPRISRRGWVLLVAVFIYGLATTLFGLSRSFGLTFLCLLATGAADEVSTVLRNIIRQLSTPDHLRGRMVSVNMIFFMGGPQLGELEAGLVANWLGAPISVISGGLACLIVTLGVGWKTPSLRRYRQEAVMPPPDQTQPAAAGS